MRTDEKLDEICTALMLHCGDMMVAAQYSGVSPMFIHQWMKDDTTAAEKIQEAQHVGYLGLESEARRRAVDGVEEDIYYKGEVVGKKTSYSDGLLGKLLEANVPKYSKKEQGGNNFLGPTQINIMPRADSYEDWLAMKSQTLAQRDEMPALEGPEKVPAVLQGQYLVEDAEYEDVSDEAKAAHSLMSPNPLDHLKDLL